jgi:hypothetical protein
MLGWSEFLSIGAFCISVGAFCISALSLWLTWQRDRKARRATYPLIEVHVFPFEGTIHSVLLNITNQRDHHIYLRKFEVMRPRGAAFVEHEDRDFEPPIIFKERRARIRHYTTYLSERGKHGSQCSVKIFLDGGKRRLRTVVFGIEFDLFDFGYNQRKRFWITSSLR